MTNGEPVPQLESHRFRWESGRIVSHLTGLLGSQHLQLAEDAAQEAMLRAVQTWPFQGIPENPSAWLFRVARNYAISALRRNRIYQSSDRYDADGLIAKLESPPQPVEELDLERVLRDDELRMIFMCCHPDLQPNARVALSLKLIGGFSTVEIARLFLAPEPTIAQRLVRAKKTFRERSLPLDVQPGRLNQRLDSVLDAIYLMFSAGYTRHSGENLIGNDACFEAIRLGQLLADSSVANARAKALLALMYLQAARFPARTDAIGELVPFEEQNRQAWDSALIERGFFYFEGAIGGDEISTWHVQAAIAAIYTRAQNSYEVDWTAILDEYDLLRRMTDAPLVYLNRAVIVGKVHGAAAGLAAVEDFHHHGTLGDYYLVPVVRGHLLMQLGRWAEAETAFSAALQFTCSEPEKRFIRSRLTIARETVRGKR